jgi:hypothetical protein
MIALVMVGAAGLTGRREALGVCGVGLAADADDDDDAVLFEGWIIAFRCAVTPSKQR